MGPDLVVQSNAPSNEPAANGPLRINSGFYRARATPVVVAAFEAIVAHAAASSLTEQPSFYIVLCAGKDGDARIGDSHCQYRPAPEAVAAANTALSLVRADRDREQALENDRPQAPSEDLLLVEFLDRDLFPAGAWKNFWDSPDIKKAYPQLVVLHNNWIKGLQAKAQRLVNHHLWWYDRTKMICSYAQSPVFVLDWDLEAGNQEE
jgi:hypothetical protein